MGHKVRIAAGVVVARTRPAFQTLMLRATKGGHWSPPKGHTQEDESLLETAWRETVEETGLPHACLELVDRFERTITYEVRVRGKRKTKVRNKAVTYYLARMQGNHRVVLSSEHDLYAWVGLEQALALARHSNLQELLRAAALCLQQEQPR